MIFGMRAKIKQTSLEPKNQQMSEGQNDRLHKIRKGKTYSQKKSVFRLRWVLVRA